MQPDPEVGRRVEQLRRRTGLSRERLAGLADISVVLIKFIETGKRSLTLRTAQRLAPHLGVRDLADLFGPQVHLRLEATPSHPGIPEVRRALTAWHLSVQGDPASPQYLRGAVDTAWRTWHTSRQQRTDAGALLPGLLDTAQRSVRLLDGADRRAALPMLAEAYHLAQAYLAWHGDRELMWLCVDRGMAAAQDADDPLAISGATWYAAHLLRAVGRSDDALARLAEARSMIEPWVPDGAVEYAAMLADLHLCSALTRARSGDQGAWQDWESARAVVTRALPPDYVGAWTRISPVLVDVYAVMVAVELGDPDEARRRAERLDPQTIPSTDRRARHLLELARGTDMDSSQEATLHLLTRATDVSAETVAFSPIGRDMVQRLVTDGPLTIRADAEALARRVGVDA